jgi:hypothetical protein
MASVPVLEVGQSVLVANAPDEPPWRMVVDVVQGGHVTLATVDDEHLPTEWRNLTETHLTTIDQFSVHHLHVPVLRVSQTRMVVGEPDDATPVTRRAYARVFAPVPASCMLLSPEENRWFPFPAEIRDLGGGGCSLVADVLAPGGATVIISLAIASPPVVAVGRALPREALPTIGRVLTRIEFVLIREVDRDRIMGFILHNLASQRHVQRS